MKAILGFSNNKNVNPLFLSIAWLDILVNRRLPLYLIFSKTIIFLYIDLCFTDQLLQGALFCGMYYKNCRRQEQEYAGSSKIAGMPVGYDGEPASQKMAAEKIKCSKDK